jgi:IS1 family transposase
MPTLSIEKQTAIVSALVEGCSIRSTERMTGVHRNTIGKLVLRMGRACDRLAEKHIRHVRCEQLELDEVWGFVRKKRNHVRRTDDASKVGDFWTWCAIDPDSKLVPAVHVGKRLQRDADTFAKLLRRRVEGRVQLNTDKLIAYRGAILSQFSEVDENGQFIRPDWGSIVKQYVVEPSHEGRYSPPRCVSIKRRVETGTPDYSRISTSHVERLHLTSRMEVRRLTRLTNGFSKTPEHLKAAVALHFAHYNFVRKHSTVRTTPAVAAGIQGRPWTMGELVEWGGVYGHG